LVAGTLVSGCSMKAEKKLEYYEQVQTLPYESIQTFKNSDYKIMIQGYTDNSIRMTQYAFARIEGDNELLIYTYTVRQDEPKVQVARSEYYYGEKDNSLVLKDYSASQTGVVGSWAIPILTLADMSKIAGKPLEKEPTKKELYANWEYNLFKDGYADLHQLINTDETDKDVFMAQISEHDCSQFTMGFILDYETKEFITKTQCDLIFDGEVHSSLPCTVMGVPGNNQLIALTSTEEKMKISAVDDYLTHNKSKVTLLIKEAGISHTANLQGFNEKLKEAHAICLLSSFMADSGQ